MPSRFARLAFAATLLAAASASAEDQSGRLWIGVEGANAPFHFIGPDRKLAGLEVEIAEEVCRRIARVCVFRITGWEELKPALLDGRIDLIASSLEIPRRGGGKIAFSGPVYTLPWAYVSKRGTDDVARGRPEAKGLRIGYEKDGSAADFLARRNPGAAPVPFAGRVEALLELAAGRIDLVLLRRDHAAEWLNGTPEGRCCRVLAEPPADIGLSGRGVGIGTRAMDSALRAAVDGALAQMREDGTLAEIVGRWQLFPMM